MALGEALQRRLTGITEELASYLTTRMQQKVSILYPPASDPGEPPHKRTGNLQGSIGYQVTGPLEAEISATADYAADLEFGRSDMAPRPFFQSTIQEEMDELRAIIKENLS